MSFEEQRKLIAETQDELKKKLNEYRPYIDAETYDYYYALLHFQINAWTQENQERYRLFKPVFYDIISFNLKYYMIEALKRECDDSNVWYSFNDRKTSISVGHLDAKVSSSNVNSDEGWLLEIKLPYVYDEKFSTKRLEFMKKLRDELRSGGHGVYWWFSNIIDEMENGNSPLSFEELCRRQEKSREVLSFLMEKYQFKIPEEYNTSEFDINMSELSNSRLDLLEDKYGDGVVYNKTVAQDTANRKILLTTPLIHSYNGKKIIG